MSTIYRQIEEHYNLELPGEYLEMSQRGWFDSTNYEKLDEVEWMSLQEILDFKFQDHQKAGLVPFAHTGRGDLWCWWPEKKNERGTPVVFCPLQLIAADHYAPDFLSFLYRRTLEYGESMYHPEPDDEAQDRERMRRWAVSFGSYFPPTWLATLKEITERPIVRWHGRISVPEYGFINPQEYQEILKRDLQYEDLDKEFEWMT